LTSGGVFYATHSGIDANPYDLKPAHPKAAAKAIAYLTASAEAPWHRPFLLYLLASALTAAAAAQRVTGWRLLVAILLGALAYSSSLFFVGPAADARYIFPSNVFCALVSVLAGGLILHRKRPVDELDERQAMPTPPLA
jgi:hypothetical protein